MGEKKGKKKGKAVKLCKLVKKDFPADEFKKYTVLVGSPRFICTKCGRAAASEENLCKPRAVGT